MFEHPVGDVGEGGSDVQQGSVVLDLGHRPIVEAAPRRGSRRNARPLVRGVGAVAVRCELHLPLFAGRVPTSVLVEPAFDPQVAIVRGAPA